MSGKKAWRAGWVSPLIASLGLFTAAACGGLASTNGGDGNGGDGDGGDGDGDGDGDGLDRSCSATADCALVNADCCSCGTQATENVVAVNVGHVDSYRSEVCGSDPTCPDCVSIRNPRLFSVCEAGTCRVASLETGEATGCETADECIIIPAACCECGAGTTEHDIVAINASHAGPFREFQCASAGNGAPVDCLDCDWTPPEDLEPACATGHCVYVSAAEGD